MRSNQQGGQKPNMLRFTPHPFRVSFALRVASLSELGMRSAEGSFTTSFNLDEFGKGL
jgi:hypothetical protein